jgi:hypothetical protein
MDVRLPPPDPHESLGMQPTDGPRVSLPTAVFALGTPSPLDDRISDEVLDLRPGILIVVGSA